jgi:Protein of unknown function (DUF3304)
MSGRLHPMRRFSRHLPRCLLVAVLTAIFLTACQARDSEETVAVSITGLDHLAEHLSVQDFWVDGHHAHQAGRGGRQVCCASLPRKWHPGLSVTVRWGVTNWRDHVYSMQERSVAVPQYDKVGRLWVHFLKDGSVKVFSANVGPGFYEPNVEYPGPQPLTDLPRKQPWTDYKSTKPAGMTEFPQVEDALKDQPK